MESYLHMMTNVTANENQYFGYIQVRLDTGIIIMKWIE